MTMFEGLTFAVAYYTETYFKVHLEHLQFVIVILELVIVI